MRLDALTRFLVVLGVMAAFLAGGRTPLAWGQQPPRPQPRPQAGAGTAAGGDEDDEQSDEELDEEEEEPQAARRTVRTEGEPAARSAPDAAETAGATALRRARVRPTILGPSGLIRTVAAETGAPGTFRVSLDAYWFGADDFLTRGDHNQNIGGNLSINYAPIEYAEIFASIQNYANYNSQSSPVLFQVLGDTIVGAKGQYSVAPWFSAGLDVGAYLLNTVGNIGLNTVSFGFRLATLFDVHRAFPSVPVRVHLNIGYYFDQSYELVRGVEETRSRTMAQNAGATYSGTPCDQGLNADGTAPRGDYNGDGIPDGCLSRTERFALGINRTDRMDFRIGLEAPLPYVTPMVEWHMAVPVNRQSFDCLDTSTTFLGDVGHTGSPDDSCLTVQQIEAFPMTLTIGARFIPPWHEVRGLSAQLAVDIGLTGIRSFVRELAANAPYRILFGLAWYIDPDPPAREVVRQVERRVEVARPPAAKGRIRGRVKDQESNQAVAGAIVSFAGRDLTALASGQDGSFLSYEFDPGQINMELRHAEYNPGTCQATVAAAGGDVTVECAMQHLPRLATVAGRVTDEDSHRPVPNATIVMTGPQEFRLTSGPDGAFSQERVPPGPYVLRVEAEGYMMKQKTIEPAANDRLVADVDLRRRPRQALVVLRRDRIEIRRQVHFQTNSAEILPDSNALLEEVVDTILRNPQIRRIDVQGHTDDVGGREYNQGLSQRRAESVRAFLIQNGVPAEKLESHGHGMDRPLVPNITAGNRARNRRVEFHISDQGTPETRTVPVPGGPGAAGAAP